jgi:hypothetical protein
MRFLVADFFCVISFGSENNFGIARNTAKRRWLRRFVTDADRRRARRVTRLQRRAILSTGTTITSGHFRELEHRIVMRPDEESRSGRLADFKWSSLRI